MKFKPIWTYLLGGSLIVTLPPLPGRARQNAASAMTGAHQAPTQPDGRHDFDFWVGSWKSHNGRLLHPLTGSKTWVEFDGTVVARPVWEGRAILDEFQAESPTGRIEALTLSLYNPQARQWSLYSAGAQDGHLGQPTIGEFKGGRGEFLDQEPFQGRTILVRNVWSDITPNSCRWEQAFSEDGGRTWEVNWVATLTRVQDHRDNATVIPPLRQ